ESRALADETGLTVRARGGTLAEREQQRDLGAAVECTLRVVPAVERECDGKAAFATQQVREPQRRRGVRIDHPERRAIAGGQRGCERGGGAWRRAGRRHAECLIPIVIRRRELRGPKPRKDRDASAAPRAHRLNDAGLVPSR